MTIKNASLDPFPIWIRRPGDQEPILPRWRIVESSNVERIGWDADDNMYVRYTGSGKTYMYVGVTRQRAVAAARAKSVGSYIARKIKGHYAPIHLD